jgi:hypothetical protein
MKYNPKGIENYLAYLGSYRKRIEENENVPHLTDYDFELEHKLVEQCEAGDFIHAVESPIRDTE